MKFSPSVARSQLGAEGRMLQDHHSSLRQRVELVIPSGRDPAQAIVLAAMIFAPELTGQWIGFLDPTLFSPPLWRQLARVAKGQLRGMGAVDLAQVRWLLATYCHLHEQVIELELATLRAISQFLHNPVWVARAASSLTRRNLT